MAAGLIPAPVQTGHTTEAISLWRDMCWRMGTDALPCSFFDIQGPLNTAAVVCRQEQFLLELMEMPDEVKRFLDIVTGQIIGICRSFLPAIPESAGPLWPYIWLPADIGIGITEDYMPLISPESTVAIAFRVFPISCDSSKLSGGTTRGSGTSFLIPKRTISTNKQQLHAKR